MEVEQVRPGGRTRLRVTLITDASGSVEAVTGNGMAVLVAWQRALTELAGMPVDLALRLVTFGEEMVVVTAPRDGEQDPERLAGFVPGPRALLECLEKRSARAGPRATRLWRVLDPEVRLVESLAAADRLAGADTAYAMVLVTDCQVARSPLREDVLARARRLQVPIFLVPIEASGEGARSYGGPDPACVGLASRTGGDPASIDLASTLVAVARRFAGRYRVTFRPPPGLAGRPELRVDLRPREGIPLEVRAPPRWFPPAPVAERVRRALEGVTALRALRAVAETVALEGGLDETRLLYRWFRDSMRGRARARGTRLARGTTLPVAEAGLDRLGREYLEMRAVVFRGVFRAIARGLLHGSPRDQRAAAALAEEIHRYIGAPEGPYSLEHVLGPVMDTFLDPDFPADPRARETITRIHRPGGAPGS